MAMLRDESGGGKKTYAVGSPEWIREQKLLADQRNRQKILDKQKQTAPRPTRHLEPQEIPLPSGDTATRNPVDVKPVTYTPDFEDAEREELRKIKKAAIERTRDQWHIPEPKEPRVSGPQDFTDQTEPAPISTVITSDPKPVKGMLIEDSIPEKKSYYERIEDISRETRALSNEEKEIMKINQDKYTLAEFSEEDFNRLREIKEKRDWLYKLRDELENEQRKIISHMSSIWDQVKSKYAKLTSFENYYDLNLATDNKYERHYQSQYEKLLDEWTTLWGNYSDEYKKLGDQVGWEAVSMPSYDDLVSPDSKETLINAEHDNYLEEGKIYSAYYLKHQNEYQLLEEEAQEQIELVNQGEKIAELIESRKTNLIKKEYPYLDIDELQTLYTDYKEGKITAASLVTGTYIPVDSPVTIDTLLSNLNELEQLDSESKHTAQQTGNRTAIDINQETLKKGYPTIKAGNTLQPIYLADLLLNYNNVDNQIHIQERTLLANLNTVANLYQLNGKEEVDMKVVWLLSETGNQGRSVILEQKPKENKLVILDPSGIKREVYAFEVSYTPNENEDLAEYMRNSFDKEFHHTEWYEIPGLTIMGGFTKLANSVHGLAALAVETVGGDMSKGREILSVLLEDLGQEAGQAGIAGEYIYSIGSEILPSTIGVLADSVLPVSSLLLSIGDNYNEGMSLMQGQNNADLKARAYAFAVSIFEVGVSEYVYDPTVASAIKNATSNILTKYGTKNYDAFIGAAVESIMASPQDKLYALMGQTISGTTLNNSSEKQIKGEIFGYMMQCISEGDQDMIAFMERKMDEKSPWTKEDLSYVINKMTGQTTDQKSVDHTTLTPYTPPADYSAVNTFGQMTTDGTIQRISDGTLQGSNFILDTNSLDPSTRKALDVSRMPQIEASSVSTEETQPALDEIQIGDMIRNAHNGTREPVGEANGQVYFTNKYDSIVSIPKTVYDIIHHSGFSIFALDNGNLAITNGTEIVGFAYISRRK